MAASRLTPVLRLRKRVEESRAIALAVAVRDCAAATRTLQALRAQAELSRRAVITALLSGATVSDTWADAELARRTAAAATRQAARVAEEEARVMAARAQVVNAAQERRAVERVLELREDERRHAAGVSEQHRLDDVATTRAARRILRGGTA